MSKLVARSIFAKYAILPLFLTERTRRDASATMRRSEVDILSEIGYVGRCGDLLCADGLLLCRLLLRLYRA